MLPNVTGLMGCLCLGHPLYNTVARNMVAYNLIEYNVVHGSRSLLFERPESLKPHWGLLGLNGGCWGHSGLLFVSGFPNGSPAEGAPIHPIMIAGFHSFGGRPFLKSWESPGIRVFSSLGLLQPSQRFRTAECSKRYEPCCISKMCALQGRLLLREKAGVS